MNKLIVIILQFLPHFILLLYLLPVLSMCLLELPFHCEHDTQHPVFTESTPLVLFLSKIKPSIKKTNSHSPTTIALQNTASILLISSRPRWPLFHSWAKPSPFVGLYRIDLYSVASSVSFLNSLPFTLIHEHLAWSPGSMWIMHPESFFTLSWFP